MAANNDDNGTRGLQPRRLSSCGWWEPKSICQAPRNPQADLFFGREREVGLRGLEFRLTRL
jgi:hypothetical protein